MRVRVLLVVAALATMGLVPPPAHAAYAISAGEDETNGGYDPIFNPRAPRLLPGTQVVWTNNDLYGTPHTVTAYYGGSFASAQVTTGSSFAATYGGGTVLYRCLYHSSFDDRVDPPACQGMCGAIHDAGPDVFAPSARITTPNGFVFTGAVRIDGVASDNRAVRSVVVRIRPAAEIAPLLVTRQAIAECLGCEGPSVLWTSRANPGVTTYAPFINLPPGQYRVEATAVDPAGNTASATPISIYVLR